MPSRKKQKPATFLEKHHRAIKWVGAILCALLFIALGIFIAFKVSPWPASMLIRYEFDKGGAKTAKELEKYVPPGITELQNQRYRQNDKDGYLDVFYADATAKQQPTIVWVHGGAWISGDKDNIDNYLKILAGKGYTTVGVDYSIAPEHTYPLPIFQVNDALKYVQENAERLHIDPNNIVLAGDSAGSQIVAQIANAITNPAYASEMGLQPTLLAKQLKGVVLNCGAYDLSLPNYNGPDGDFLRTVLWAYSGSKDFMNDPKLKQASVANYLTKDFPPAFITAGNADPLEAQSKELAQRLHALNVSTSTLFYEDNHQPALQHEYQFSLDTPDARRALDQIVSFLAEYLK